MWQEPGGADNYEPAAREAIKDIIKADGEL